MSVFGRAHRTLPLLAGLAAVSPALGQSLNSAVDDACARGRPLVLTGDQAISEPITHSCDGLIVDLAGYTINYVGPKAKAVIDMRPKATEPWRVRVRVRHGEINGGGKTDYAIDHWAVSHAVFDDLSLRDVALQGIRGTYLVLNTYRDISCSGNERPWVMQPQGCFLTYSDGTPSGFGIWASTLQNMIAERLSGTGITIVGNINTMIGGTSEGNKVGLNIDGDYNMVLNADLEENAVANRIIKGKHNTLNMPEIPPP